MFHDVLVTLLVFRQVVVGLFAYACGLHLVIAYLLHHQAVDI